MVRENASPIPAAGGSDRAANVAGDLDCDDTLSVSGFLRFDDCMTGADAGLVAGFCVCADFPASPPDGDVDLADFARLQRSFTGYGRGACCHASGSCSVTPNGSCSEVTQAQCATLGGTFHPLTTCAAVDCTTDRYSNTAPPPPAYIDPNPGYGLADDMALAGSGSGNLIHYDVMVYRPSGGTYSVTGSLHTACPPSTSNQIAGTSYTWNNLTAGATHTLNADFPPVSIPASVWLRLQFSAADAGWMIAGQAEIGYTQDRIGAATPSWGCYNSFGGNPWAGLWANLTFGGGLDAPPPEPTTWVETEIPEVPPVRVPWQGEPAPIIDSTLAANGR